MKVYLELWLQYHITHILVVFQVAALLATVTHSSHSVIYVTSDSISFRPDATRNILGIQ
ncbi:hypothetical protein Xhom_00983 [Xenorhabdus hominickii]|uniref:Uncharacterized protein n=1 Tax=Xenorhabdus hominickii TaxID=351679 RepID=A0A2G0QFP1_XENHO|nr:hypothetical protein Xhom_00983 [Xenorhabdus hominickii]